MPQKFNYIDFSKEISSLPSKSASLSKDRYISRDFMAMEWDGIWTKTWLFAGIEADITEIGDFFVYDIGRESIVITRDENERISAFYNVCQHRGNKIVTLESGSLNKISCPYHGWSYALNGKLEHVPDRELFEGGVPCEEKSLKSVRVSVWAGLIFINMDENSPSLETFLGPIIDQLKPYKFEEMNLVKHQTVDVLETNWKTNSTTLSPSNPVTLSWTNNKNITFKINYQVDDEYMFTITQEIENNSGEDIEVFPYRLIKRINTPDTINFFIGTPITIYEENFDSGLGEWVVDGEWGLTDEPAIGSYALTCFITY